MQTSEHFLDALTGVDGTPTHDYLAAHFRYPDALVRVPLDLVKEQR